MVSLMVMDWILYVMIPVIIGLLVWQWVRNHKNGNPGLSNYLFAYRIIEEDDTRAMPTEFLVKWQVFNLENHLYLLYLTLEEDLDMKGYLHKVWVHYRGFDNVYIDVYRVDGKMNTKHTLIGKCCIREGRMCYTPV